MEDITKKDMETKVETSDIEASNINNRGSYSIVQAKVAFEDCLRQMADLRKKVYNLGVTKVIKVVAHDV